VKLTGRVAIVTGASRGIGKSIACALANEGVNVVVAARSETEGHLPGTIHKTVQEISASGGNALAVKTDVTKEEEVDGLVQKVLDYYKRIDILVNNAGISSPGTLMEISIKRWDLIMAVNLRGTFLCTKTVLPCMVSQGNGSIINVSSIVGTKVTRRQVANAVTHVAYAVTKAAIERLTVGLAQEVRQYNIAVNALCPNYTDTEGLRMLSADRDRSSWQKPEIWGRYAAFLACQDASSLTGKCLTTEELDRLISGKPRAS